MTNKTSGKSRSGSLLVPFAMVCALLAGCGGAPDESRVQRYELKGQIVSFNKAQQQVVVKHEEVPGFMEAMTMPFTLREDSAFDVMRAGDQIQATLVVDDERTRLENPVITQAMPLAAAAATPTDAPTEPEIGATIPDATLVNQDGKQIKLQQYRARALVITFIYTRCPLPDYCTLMSNNFAEIKRGLDKSPELRDRAHLLSITLDPAYDTPQVLRSYGAGHTENYGGEKFENWELATGKPAEIRRVANFLGLIYAQEGTEINHSLRTAIIAPDGKLYKLYRGNEWKPAEILNDLRALNGTQQPS